MFITWAVSLVPDTVTLELTVSNRTFCDMEMVCICIVQYSSHMWLLYSFEMWLVQLRNWILNFT